MCDLLLRPKQDLSVLKAKPQKVEAKRVSKADAGRIIHSPYTPTQAQLLEQLLQRQVAAQRAPAGLGCPSPLFAAFGGSQW